MAKKQAKNMKKAEGNGISDLIKELWNSAVTLRGSIEPADYKRYVLPIIFLRFLSMRFEKRRLELVEKIGDNKSDYFTTSKKAAETILNDPDEYRSAGAFIIPEKARWDYILQHAQDDDIKVKLDNALEMLETTYADKLRGLLPRIYAGSNMEREHVTGLINLFSKEIFKQEHGGVDVLGRVYEYFIGEFASSEGKRGGEYFTPQSIVQCLVRMLEPEEGVVYDPCCGSGGMFVQSDIFTHHNHKLSFFGQESKDFTNRLCKMNLFIHGIDGNIQPGNTYFDDKHATLKADYIIANPPFNDGSKSEKGWGSDRVPDKDPRLVLGTERMPLSPRNANTMWIMHFLHHLKKGGTAGFVMASGELTNAETTRYLVRKTLVENDVVDCIVRLSGQLFANTPIPCSLWFISTNREGLNGFRNRKGEILFIDANKMGLLIPGSRKQKQLSEAELNRIAEAYHIYKYDRKPDEILGFCKVADIEAVRAHNYALTAGRYVGTEEIEDEDEPFEIKFPALVAKVKEEFGKSDKLKSQIQVALDKIGYVS